MSSSYDSGLYVSIHLKCGKSFNGTIGCIPNYKMQLKLHKKVCKSCKCIKSHELDLYTVDHHYITKKEGYKSIGALSSMIHKY